MRQVLTMFVLLSWAGLIFMCQQVRGIEDLADGEISLSLRKHKSTSQVSSLADKLELLKELREVLNIEEVLDMDDAVYADLEEVSFWRSLQNETEVPTTAPSASPSSPLGKEPFPESMIWGIVGFVLLGLALVLAFFTFYSNRSHDKTVVNQEEEANVLKYPIESKQPNPRDSMSTVFSRGRLSTWSGRYSGKIEAMPGKDEALSSYVRERRHERNTKKDRRKKKKNETQATQSQNPSLTRRGTQGSVSKRKQGTHMETTSLREVQGDSSGLDLGSELDRDAV